jgi:protein TonB
MPGAAKSEERAQAAAAGSVSSQRTSFAEPAPSFVPAAGSTAPLSAPAATTEMHSATDEIHATPPVLKLNPQSGSLSASYLSESSLSESSPDRAVSAELKPARPLRPSDDPVLAELERTELEESQRESSILENSGPSKAAPLQPAAKSGAPAFSSYRQGRQKRRGPLVALLMLVLAGASFYAVWTYQPGFRDLAQPKIDRVLALAGMALPPTPAPNPVKPSTQLTPATTSAPALESPADPNQTQSKAPDFAMSSATRSATGSPMASAVATPPVPPAATPGTAVAPPASAATAPTAPVATKPEANKTSDKLAKSKKDTSAATPSDAPPLPGESSAIILSSKGAEKRLVQSVPPKYPVDARSAQGTVVLKAVVDETGKVEGLRLVEGNATLATAAIQAVKQWRYRPYVRDGKTQAFQTVVIVDFQRP